MTRSRCAARRARGGVHLGNIILVVVWYMALSCFCIMGLVGCRDTVDTQGWKVVWRGEGVSSLWDVWFTSTNEAWVTGPRVILHSEDGGATWQRETRSTAKLAEAPRHTTWLLQPSDDGTWVAVAGPRAAYWTWHLVRGELILDISGVSMQEAWAIAFGSPNRLLHTVDGGMSWGDIPPNTIAGLRFDPCGVFFRDGQSGWILGSLARASGSSANEVVVCKTTDGGRTFHAVAVPGMRPGGEVPWAIKFVNTVEGWAATGGPELAHTTDAGETWEVVRPLAGDPLEERTFLKDLSFALPDAGRVVGAQVADGYKSVVLTTRDGGHSWIREDAGIESRDNDWVRRIASGDAGHVLALAWQGVWPSDMRPIYRRPYDVSLILRRSPPTSSYQ